MTKIHIYSWKILECMHTIYYIIKNKYKTIYFRYDDIELF